VILGGGFRHGLSGCIDRKLLCGTRLFTFTSKGKGKGIHGAMSQRFLSAAYKGKEVCRGNGKNQLKSLTRRIRERGGSGLGTFPRTEEGGKETLDKNDGWGGEGRPSIKGKKQGHRIL